MLSCFTVLVQYLLKSTCLRRLHRYVCYRRVPPFRPGKGYKLSHVLFDTRLSVHSQREVEKLSSVAIGMASETIATCMALRAGMIGQQRHLTSL